MTMKSPARAGVAGVDARLAGIGVRPDGVAARRAGVISTRDEARGVAFFAVAFFAVAFFAVAFSAVAFFAGTIPPCPDVALSFPMITPSRTHRARAPLADQFRGLHTLPCGSDPKGVAKSVERTAQGRNTDR